METIDGIPGSGVIYGVGPLRNVQLRNHDEPLAASTPLDLHSYVCHAAFVAAGPALPRHVARSPRRLLVGFQSTNLESRRDPRCAPDCVVEPAATSSPETWISAGIHRLRRESPSSWSRELGCPALSCRRRCTVNVPRVMTDLLAWNPSPVDQLPGDH
jgi:hypothetical protein